MRGMQNRKWKEKKIPSEPKVGEEFEKKILNNNCLTDFPFKIIYNPSVSKPSQTCQELFEVR